MIYSYFSEDHDAIKCNMYVQSLSAVRMLFLCLVLQLIVVTVRASVHFEDCGKSYHLIRTDTAHTIISNFVNIYNLYICKKNL